MENREDEQYVKVLLYAYPTLQTLIEQFREHIYERAVRSYGGRKDAESAATYIAEQIISMQTLEWVQQTLEKVFSRLSQAERLMVQIRYFGLKRKSAKGQLAKEGKQFLCERSYFRAQEKLLKKIAALLQAAWLDKEYFDKQVADIEELKHIRRYVQRGRDQRLFKREKDLALKG